MAWDDPRVHRFDRLRGRVQRVRVDAQDLLVALDRIEGTFDLESEDARKAELKAAISEAKALLASKPIDEHIREIDEILNDDDSVAEAVGDPAWRIHGDLEEARRLFGEIAADDSTLASVNATRAKLERIQADAAELTIPKRLREHLDGMPVGKALGFHATFADELPDRGQRQALLERLSGYESVFGGVVDAKNGLVYKVSRSKTWRVLSYFSPLIFTVLAGGFLFLVGSLDNFGIDLSDDWHLNNRGKLLSAFILVLTGAVIHLIVENIEQLQSTRYPDARHGHTWKRSPPGPGWR